jgi:hypothetical protein
MNHRRKEHKLQTLLWHGQFVRVRAFSSALMGIQRTSARWLLKVLRLAEPRSACAANKLALNVFAPSIQAIAGRK